MSRTAYTALWIFLLMVLSTTAAPLNVSNENVRMNAPGGGGEEGDGPVVRITYPSGGEVFNVGDVIFILYNNDDLSGDIILEFTTDGNSFYGIATKPISPSSSFQHEWTVLNVPTTTAQIRITSTSDSTITDISDYFTIVGGPCDNVSGNVVQWDSTVAANPGYSAGTPVEYALMSGNVWVSLIDQNTNTPGVGDGWIRCTCEELASGEVWATNMGYGVGQVVAHNGMFWISTFSPNNGYEPGVDLDAWRPCIDEGDDPCENANGLAGPWYDQSVIYYSQGDVVEYPAGSGDYYVSNRDQNSAHPTDGTLRGWDLCSCSDLSDGTTWQSGNAYSAYQIVEHNGVLYVKKNAYVVAIGGDPEPGVAKGWTIFWRPCEPGNCAPVGLWNQADATAGYYDVGVVVKTIAWSATKWVSTVEDNALSPAFGNGWTWCKVSPWDPTIYYPGPVAPPSTTGGGYDDPTHARLKQGTTVATDDAGTEGRDKVSCPDRGTCDWTGTSGELGDHLEESGHGGMHPGPTHGGGGIRSDTAVVGVTFAEEMGNVCADLTLGDDDTCFERRVVTGGDTSTGGCWTDSDGLAAWKDDCGEGDVAGVLSVSEHPPIVTGDCNDEMLAEVGVFISNGMYASLDVGGHLLVQNTGVAPAPQCGAVVTIAASDLPLLEHLSDETDGRDKVSCSYRETCSWTGTSGEYGDHMATHDGEMHPGPTSDGRMVYGYVITSSDGTIDDDGTDARSSSGREKTCEFDVDCDIPGQYCVSGSCEWADDTYLAMNFVGLTCDAIDSSHFIEGVMCDDAVIIEAHADHLCGGAGACAICEDAGISGGGGTEPPVEGDDPVLPGFSLIMAMCALLSAVIIRRRPE